MPRDLRAVANASRWTWARASTAKSRVRVLELEQVLDPRAAESIDALVVVAHHGQVRARAAQQLHQLELGVVGVLEFVDEDVLEAVLVLAPQVGSLAQQAQREADLV